jgi:hypothetical protein
MAIGQLLPTICFGGLYYSRDLCRGNGIWAFGTNGTTSNSDADNFWSYQQDQNAVTGLWAAEASHDYYQNTYGRNGVNNSGKGIQIFSESTSQYDYGLAEYHWTGGGCDELHFGTTDFFISNPMLCFDVLAHEYTHGVTYYSCNLNHATKSGPNDEAGALNESFSDIMSKVIEYHTLGYTNWVFGSRLSFSYLGGIYFFNESRNLSNPAASGGGYSHQPSIYRGAYWDFTNFRAHNNDGVQNHWFYLLANGGTFNGITISAIGIDKAAKIVYNELQYFIQTYSTYADARNASINAAIYLYGPCSNEVRQVKNAWGASGVGTPDDGAGCLTVSGPSSQTARLHCVPYPFDIYYLSHASGGSGLSSLSWSGGVTGQPVGSMFEATGATPGYHSVTCTARWNNGTSSSAHATTLFGDVGCFVHHKTSPQEAMIKENPTFEIYPNPAQNSINYVIPGSNQSGILTVYDISGRLLVSAHIDGESGYVPLPAVSDGIYIVHIKTELVNSTKKIEIRH